MLSRFICSMGLCLLMCLFACTNSESQAPTSMDGPEQNATKEKIKASTTEINEQERLFGIPAAKLTYRYGGKYSGTETVWFDNYGARVVMEQEIQRSPKIYQKQRIIWNESKEKSMVCTYEEMGKDPMTCQKTPIRPKDSELSLFAHGDETQLKYGYDPLGTKTIAGKEAKGWQSKSSDQIQGWIWEGIDVAYSNMGVEKELLSIEPIDAIPSELLGMPAGFRMK